MGSLSKHMGRYVSWLANAGLLVLCCFLVAGTANAIFAALLVPGPALVDTVAAAPPAIDRSWEARESILQRNLFHAMLAPPPPPPPPPVEKIEATKLPLALIGTVASENPDLAWAALNDTKSREHLVVQAGDSIQGKATVTRIEARRILLSENGVLRELVLDDAPAPPTVNRAQQQRNAKKARASRRAKARQAKLRAARAAAPKPPPPASPTSLEQFMSEIQISPNFDANGTMQGFEVGEIRPGGILEGLGVQKGDLITELNGIQLTSPEDTVRILGSASPDGLINVKVLGQQGEQVLAIPAPNKE